MPMLRRTSRKPAGESFIRSCPSTSTSPCVRSFQQVHTSHQRGLSCAGQPDDAEYLAVLPVRLMSSSAVSAPSCVWKVLFDSAVQS